MVTENNQLDGRPDCAPSHWNEHFQIYYLTQKMRSQKDPNFSNLCDRVGRGNINEEDEKFLQSRVQLTETERCNKNFKNGDLSIIVTTNKKKDLINRQKLDELLPDVREYICNSVDRVTNMPGRKLPNRLKENPGKTGNLQTELRLKVGAPVLITSNHSKKKYKEDGIVNGARGFVQSIQVSKGNPEKVDIIWVVFNKETVGRLYRFEQNHLRQNHNPGHKLATPIQPERKNFKERFGNIEYQRTNFALSLAYAMTAHKCQGETLDQVIIDFGPNLELKIKNYICPGSFYVALTRVREGNKVFLKSFDKSYIQVNKSIEEKIEAMKKFRPYKFKKIYLDQKIFKLENSEIKAGYLNINGLVDGNHDQYLNADYNLRNLDMLVVAETKLDEHCLSQKLSDTLDNWNIFNRYDSDDGLKHMGLILLTGKQSSIQGQFKSVTHLPYKYKERLQIQGLIVRLLNGLTFGFIYCRSCPTNPEIKAIRKYFGECNFLMGDFNLSHRIKKDQLKIENLCEKTKINFLKEITRTISNNQLDYILMDEEFVRMCFATSYNNFISDHNSIVLRVALNGNQFTDEMKEKITFDEESHLRTKFLPASSSNSERSNTSSDSDGNHKISEDEMSNEDLISNEDPISSEDPKFKRKFRNIDQTSCWLNSCVQLILSALDHLGSREILTSELGIELMHLKNNYQGETLDSTNVKLILVASEDTRIGLRLSELTAEIFDPIQLELRTEAVQNLRLNLISGQQCVRDFFLCLHENLASWPDVLSCFGFNITHSTICLSCRQFKHSETTQMYVELQVPPNDSNLNEYVEEYFNKRSLVQVFCENCQSLVEGEKRSTMTSTAEAEFVVILLTRAVETLDGYQLNMNRINPTNDVFIR